MKEGREGIETGCTGAEQLFSFGNVPPAVDQVENARRVSGDVQLRSWCVSGNLAGCDGWEKDTTVKPVMRDGARHLIAAGVLLVMGTLAVGGAVSYSPTVDEPYHLTRGLAYWWADDSRLSYAHPPLGNIWAGIPGALSAEVVPFEQMAAWRDSDVEQLAASYFGSDYAAARKALIGGRLMIVVLGLLLASSVYAFCFVQWGWPTAIIALVLLGFQPTVLAHSALVTTDVPVTLAMFLAIAGFVLALTRQRKFFLPLAAAAFGVGIATKYTALLLVPIFTALVMGSALLGLGRYSGTTSRWRRLGAGGRDLLVAGLVVLLVVNVAYRFERTGWSVERVLAEPEQQNPHTRPYNHGMLEESVLGSLPRWLPVPLPQTYLVGLASVLMNSHSDSMWFMGEMRSEAWPHYFPVLISLKSTPGLLLLIGMGAMVLALRRRSGDTTGLLILIGVAMGFFLIRSNLNIGLRHALPIYPVLAILAARAAVVFVEGGGLPSGFVAHTNRLRAPFVSLLVVSTVVSALWSHPRFIDYFNGVVGPAGGHQISIVGEDWGQDLHELAALVKEEGLEPLHYQQYGLASGLELRHAGVEHRPLGCGQSPRESTWIAIHASRAVRDIPRGCYPWMGEEEFPAFVLNDHLLIYRFEKGRQLPEPSSAHPGR